MSKADKIFKRTCKKILRKGFNTEGQKVRPVWKDGTPAHTIKRFGIVNTYDLSKEFPIVTLRKQAFKAAIDELLWMYVKKSNNVNDLNSHVWDAWADDDGCIGKTYGYQLGIKHAYGDDQLDQVDKVLKDLIVNPYDRGIIINMYNHHDLNDMNLRPCAYSITFNVVDGKLNGILNQRSNDILTANNWDVMQYAILIHMFAQVSNLKPGKLIHVIADAHIYDRHVNAVKKLIKRRCHKAPKLIINPCVRNFYDFTVRDFALSGYRYGKKVKFEIAE